MKVIITNAFKQAAKKLHRNQIAVLKNAIEKIQHDPKIGELKVGDLAGVRVYKFHLQNQLMLLAYTHNENSGVLALLSFGPHENFYKNLKN